MADPYQSSVDQALKSFQDAVQAYRAIESQIASLSSTPMDIEAGGAAEGRYKALQQQLSDASKAWIQTQSDYQTSIQLQDKAKVDAKQFDPAGTSRTRLDTVSGQVVAIAETADGRGGWNYDPKSPPAKVTIPGVGGQDTITAAPASEYILKNGQIQKNPAYKAPQPTPGSAVPTSEYVYDDQGKPVHNPAYKPTAADRPPAPDVNTQAAQVPIWDGTKWTWQANPNYKPAAATVNTTARQIPDPNNPGAFIANPNYQSPTDQLTPGQQATDTATATNATALAETNLKKAQADADTAALALQDAQRKARQAPTDQQAQQAIATAQQASDLANKNLEQQIAQSANLNPIAVQQAQATLARSKQVIDQAQQGDLYGRQEQIKQIKALVQSGDITPDEGNQMVAALNRGTTLYDVQKQQQSDQLTARGQTGTNKNALAGNFTSALTSGFSTLADMNKYATKGSSAGADAFLALLNISQDRLKSYELPAAPTTDYLGQTGGGQPSSVSGLIGAAQQQVAQPQPVQPVPQPVAPQPSYGGENIGSGAASNPQPPGVGATGAHQVTINIGSPAPASEPALAAPAYNYTPETSAQSAARNNVGGLVSQAAQKVPASEQDIYDAYGVKNPQTAGVA